MILGNSRQFRGRGYVCFLDILGFSNDVVANWGAGQSDPLEKMLAIKRAMPGFDSVEDDGTPESVRKYMCRVNTVSDSVTICFGFNNKIIIGDLVLGLEAVLANIAYVWSTFILHGYTVRGGIDFGGIYWDDGDLIGPAFINAYRLEAQVAKNSRGIRLAGDSSTNTGRNSRNGLGTLEVPNGNGAVNCIGSIGASPLRVTIPAWVGRS